MITLDIAIINVYSFFTSCPPTHFYVDNTSINCLLFI